jgi:anti-sigma regulatory factor (Ser/Thr protein kinase)
VGSKRRGQDEDPLQAQANVPDRADSVPATRAFLTKLLEGWQVDDAVIDDAALLASELMANAHEHGAGLVSMSVTLDATVLRIAVRDNDGGALPHLEDPDEGSVGGRGMWIVDAVARDWGTTDAGWTGKSVWFELSAQPWPPAGHRAAHPIRSVDGGAAADLGA